jgi:UDP-GlcNAc:undecaprenyl-phosphate GlcNAc-1-phosphate transferase
MTLLEYLLFLAALAFGFGGTAWLVRRYDLRRLNFLGRHIPSVAGLAFVLGGEFFYACESLTQGWRTSLASVYFLVTLGFGALGLLDDLKGDRSTGGFRGHFQMLRQGKITTGAVKALGGGLLSLAAGYWMTMPGPLWTALLAALLIALSANTLNLLDLRPGRCLFGFFVGAVVIWVTLATQHAVGVGMLFWAAAAFAVILYPLDAGGAAMLGDTGSNAFGAVLGVAGVIFFAPLWQAVLVVLLLAFQIWCERHSLTQWIESRPVLRALDRKIGVRGEPNSAEIRR